ncbi:MAG: hypothetical protein ABIH69_05960, partial [bacterium]
TLAYLNDNNDPSDGYATGTILITNQALISPESDLSVVYESLPSYRVSYSLRGKDSVGPYPLVPFYPVVPGSEIVEVSDGETIGDATIYTRNSSPEALDAGITGFSINYGSAEAYLVFNSSIASTESIRVEYYSTKGAPEKVLVFD